MATRKRILNVEEAAAYLEITVDELLHSRHKGLPPGRLGYTEAGQLFWRRADLIPPPRPKPVSAARGKRPGPETDTT
jgi:hypothetical protein